MNKKEIVVVKEQKEIFFKKICSTRRKVFKGSLIWVNFGNLRKKITVEIIIFDWCSSSKLTVSRDNTQLGKDWRPTVKVLYLGCLIPRPNYLSKLIMKRRNTVSLINKLNICRGTATKKFLGQPNLSHYQNYTKHTNTHKKKEIFSLPSSRGKVLTTTSCTQDFKSCSPINCVFFSLRFRPSFDGHKNSVEVSPVQTSARPDVKRRCQTFGSVPGVPLCSGRVYVRLTILSFPGP